MLRLRSTLILMLTGSLLLAALHGGPTVHGASSSSLQGRTLYLVGPSGTLTFQRPSGQQQFNGTLPVRLGFPTIQSPTIFSGASIVGELSLFLWLSSNLTVPVRTQIGLILVQGNLVQNVGSTTISLSNAAQEFSLNYTIQSPGIQLYAGFPASLNVTAQNSVPVASSVTLHWGSVTSLSQAIVPVANYASIQSAKITDYRGAENQTFNIQAPPNQNIVIFTVNVRDVFGADKPPGGDVRLVNLTISGPNGLVPGETNVTMTPFCSQTPCPQPAQYQVFWVYPSSIRQGTYSVTISLVDTQGNVIQDTSNPTSNHSFGIGQIPPPFPYLLVFGWGGFATVAGLATSVVYLRQRRGREYLAPFSFFEQMTGGEVPGGSMVTVEGNTGAGKTTLCSEIMYEDLKRGRPCLYVAADDFPDRIRSQMKNLGIDVEGYERLGLLTFVDCYSAEAGRTPTEKFYVPSVGDLTTLGVKISSALSEPVRGLEQNGTSLYLDSLSPFVPRTKSESIIAFVHAIGAKVRGIDGKAYFTMSTGSDASIQRSLEDMADCVIQMEAFEEKDVRRRRLRIRKFRNRPHQEGWATFTIEDGKGIIFYTRKTGRNN